MLGLIRRPLDLTLSLAEGVLDAGLGVVRIVRGMLEDDAPATGDAPPPAPPAPPPPSARPKPRRKPPPAPPVEDHVDTEVVAVAEFAEEGAEDGAHAELRVEEPWDGYVVQDARTVRERLPSASRELLAAVELYEATHKGRRTVLEAAERRLRELSVPGGAR